MYPPIPIPPSLLQSQRPPTEAQIRLINAHYHEGGVPVPMPAHLRADCIEVSKGAEAGPETEEFLDKVLAAPTISLRYEDKIRPTLPVTCNHHAELEKTIAALAQRVDTFTTLGHRLEAQLQELSTASSQVQDLTDRMDGLADAEDMKKRFVAVAAAMTRLKERLKKVDGSFMKRLDKVSGRLDPLDASATESAADLADLKHTSRKCVDNLALVSEKVDTHHKRLHHLETVAETASQLQGRYDGLANEYNKIKTRIESLKRGYDMPDRLHLQAAKAEALERINNLERRLETLSGSVEQIQDAQKAANDPSDKEQVKVLAQKYNHLLGEAKRVIVGMKGVPARMQDLETQMKKVVARVDMVDLAALSQLQSNIVKLQWDQSMSLQKIQSLDTALIGAATREMVLKYDMAKLEEKVAALQATVQAGSATGFASTVSSSSSIPARRVSPSSSVFTPRRTRTSSTSTNSSPRSVAASSSQAVSSLFQRISGWTGKSPRKTTKKTSAPPGSPGTEIA